ncbi:MAG: hypothetical protein PHD73_00055 [Sediminibacterium sp.]|nr:hypothetical protein [Sediminibacterium sp.]
MATSEEVQSFLQNYKVKLEIWGVIFRDERNKNAQALLNLDISPAAREKILRDLQLVDYCEGPKRENLYGGSDMWIFGKTISKQEVYIKITLGFSGRQVICISFHIAEYPMKYPFKK